PAHRHRRSPALDAHELGLDLHVAVERLEAVFAGREALELGVAVLVELDEPLTGEAAQVAVPLAAGSMHFLPQPDFAEQQPVVFEPGAATLVELERHARARPEAYLDTRRRRRAQLDPAHEGAAPGSGLVAPGSKQEIHALVRDPDLVPTAKARVAFVAHA